MSRLEVVSRKRRSTEGEEVLVSILRVTSDITSQRMGIGDAMRASWLDAYQG